ncbi:MAG TPA: hypothetical protein VLF91_02905 [Candidatus Saccharimonadales bacterium]|nr:hypothetical protein [Candidatus Saccharimonadales bacterium]
MTPVQIPPQLEPWLQKGKRLLGLLLNRYMLLTVFLPFMIVYSFLVLRVNQLSSVEPTQAQLSSKLQTVQRPSIDKATISKLQQLQGQNVQVQALFDQARQNPFAEQ